MDLHATADLDLDRARVFAALEDLGTYPRWLTIVGAASRAPAQADDAGPAWTVELVGRVGPFTRTKRVRMVRTVHDRRAGAVRFERVELDGRTHNAWVLTGEATEVDPAHTRVRVHLHYGGGRALPGADLLLRQEANRAGGRLRRYLADPG